MQWTEKYRPKTFLEIKGQDLAVEQLKTFIEESNLGKLMKKTKKALLLHGTPGTGKTTLVHVAAKEMNAEIFELNASDLRNKGKLQEMLRPAIEQQSLVKKSKIILVDEVDGISGMADRGGVTELISLISDSPYPIIITANDAWNKKLSPLRKKAELINLKEIQYNIIKNILLDILKKENLFIENDIITRISISAKGDVRAAINDLQSISQTKELPEIDERNKETDIFNALKIIFKTKPTNETLRALDSVKMPLDEVMLWVEENIPAEYTGIELAKAYDALSKTDIFKGRIYKQQYWRFLVYENIFLTYGIAASKKENKTGFTSYKKPTRILQIWLNNQKTAKKKTIAQKYARYAHVGIKRAMGEYPIIKQILKSNPVAQREIRLNEEEIEYLQR
jgi:replication factor C large subunit